MGGQAPVAEEPIVFAAPEAVTVRLARLVWNADPDPTVASRLATPVTRDGVGQLASDMLSDPRARDGVAAFYHWWLQYDLRMPTDTLGVSLQREAPALGSYLTLDADGTYTDLLTVPFTFVDEPLAQHYGMSGVIGSELRQAPYPMGEPRLGLFTGAGVLAHFSSLVNPSWPAKRGWLVTDPLLCSPVIRSFLAPGITPDPASSVRQQMIDVTQDSSCMGCHKILNSPGFAFNGFDWKGLWSPLPGAATNETHGSIPANIMADEPTFDGTAELMQLLATRDEARRCFVAQWLQFAVDRAGYPMNTAGLDGVAVDVGLRAFAASGYQLRAAIVAVARSNPFLRP